MNISKAARPRLNIDIAPLMEEFWTGIPAFTRRTVTSLTQHGGVDLGFSYQLAKIPPKLVYDAIRLGSGSFLRDAYEALAHEDFSAIDGEIPLFYPSAKSHLSGSVRYEASTIHDISTLVMPENHEEANIAYHLDHLVDELKTNDVTFCISKATEAALHLAFPSSADSTRLLYQFADWPDEFETMDRNMPGVGIGPYAAVIGTVEPRKNLSLLIDALALPELADIKFKFVVIGKKGWLADDFLARLPSDQRSRIIFSGFVSEFVKYRLLKAADFLIFPSVYEGFGIPALEAMGLGKPILASLTSSFPEVIGDAGRYFDPFSPTQFAQALIETMKSGLTPGDGERAKAQAARFDSSRMAQPLVDWASERG